MVSFMLCGFFFLIAIKNPKKPKQTGDSQGLNVPPPPLTLRCYSRKKRTIHKTRVDQFHFLTSKMGRNFQKKKESCTNAVNCLFYFFLTNRTLILFRYPPLPYEDSGLSPNGSRLATTIPRSQPGTGFGPRDSEGHLPGASGNDFH